jgi:hypothetical protein
VWEEPLVVPDVGAVVEVDMDVVGVAVGVIPGISDMDVVALGFGVGVLVGVTWAAAGALDGAAEWLVGGGGAGAELVCCVGRTVGFGLGFGDGGGADPVTRIVAVGIIE